MGELLLIHLAGFIIGAGLIWWGYLRDEPLKQDKPKWNRKSHNKIMDIENDEL